MESRLFGRPTTPSDSVVARVRAAIPSSVPAEAAIASNVLHDDRVSPAEEFQFRRFCIELDAGPPSRPVTTIELLRDYLREVRSTGRFGRSPEYDPNLVACGLGPDELPRETALVRLVGLGGLRLVVQGLVLAPEASSGRAPARRLIAGKLRRDSVMRAVETDRSWFGWLDDTCRSDPEAVVSLCIQAQNRMLRKGMPYVPQWAVLADDLDSRTLVEASDHVGLERARDDWMIAFRYTVREVLWAGTTLWRPTVLDSGGYSLHFPTPAAHRVVDGGALVHVGLPMPDRPPPREFVHGQIKLRQRHWRLAGSRMEHVPRRAAIHALPDLRRAHLSRLQLHRPAADPTWMDPSGC